MNNDILAIQREIKNLKIYKQKKASVLKTYTLPFSIDVELSYDNGRATNGIIGQTFSLGIIGDNLPIASVEYDVEDLDGRNTEVSIYPIQIPEIHLNYYMGWLTVSSTNASDIADTQGGNTKTITMNFNAISTSKLTYSGQ